MVCAKQSFLWKEKKISAPHCEFMRQALGSSAVQSAVLITSDVSRCSGLCGRRAGKGWQHLLVWAPTRMGGFGAVYQRGTTLRLPHGTSLEEARAKTYTEH